MTEMDEARASTEDENGLELGRRTNEILRFMLDMGLVDLFVGEDGEFEFSPALYPLCPYLCSGATGAP